jgi:tetratricopeptide (TPR) repeat protein
VRVPEAATYYQALALEKLGETDKATAAFQKLLDAGTQALANAPAPDALDKTPDTALRTRIADAHYLAGLGHLGLHHLDQARAEFDQALKASPDHLAAHTALADLPPNTPPAPASPAQ